MFKTICNSCFYSQVMHHKDQQSIICTCKQSAKIHRQYCPDYINKDGIMSWEKKEWGLNGKYKDKGQVYSSTSIEQFHDNRSRK